MLADFQAEEAKVFDMANATARQEDSKLKLDSAVDSRDATLVSNFYQYLNSGSAQSAAALIKEIEMREKVHQHEHSACCCCPPHQHEHSA